MTAFDYLHLDATLTLSDEQVNQAYDLSDHSAKALEARNSLRSPVTRLAEWMQHQDIERTRHAALPIEIMPLFAPIAKLVQSISELHHQRIQAQSTLAQTLLDKKLFALKPKLDDLSAQLTAQESIVIDLFDTLHTESTEKVNQVYQTLKFLQKWQVQLSECYHKLITF